MVAARCREVAVEWAEGMLLGPALRARLAVDTRFLLRFLPPVHGFRRPRPQARRWLLGHHPGEVLPEHAINAARVGDVEMLAWLGTPSSTALEAAVRGGHLRAAQWVASQLPPPDTMLQTRLLAQSEAAGSPECHDWVNGGCVAQKKGAPRLKRVTPPDYLAPAWCRPTMGLRPGTGSRGFTSTPRATRTSLF